MKTIPIVASSRIRLFALMNAMVPAASSPATKAPNANGKPRMYATATPGTTACDNASPISDQPLSVTKDDRNPQVPPTSALTQMARHM